MQIQRILRYYNVNKNDSIWYQKACVFVGRQRVHLYTTSGPNRYIFFSNAMR